jgi:hypothetical protein
MLRWLDYVGRYILARTLFEVLRVVFRQPRRRQ